MTSAFDALDAMASEASVAGFGEEAVLIPRRNSQYVEAAADADRMAVKVRGIFSALAAASDLRGQSRGGEFRSSKKVRDDDFEYQGRPYKSLSAIARAITGTPWSGPVFFGLKGGRRG